MNFIVVQYSATNNGLLKNNRFHSQGNIEVSHLGTYFLTGDTCIYQESYGHWIGRKKIKYLLFGLRNSLGIILYRFCRNVVFCNIIYSLGSCELDGQDTINYFLFTILIKENSFSSAFSLQYTVQKIPVIVTGYVL